MCHKNLVLCGTQSKACISLFIYVLATCNVSAIEHLEIPGYIKVRETVIQSVSPFLIFSDGDYHQALVFGILTTK